MAFQVWQKRCRGVRIIPLDGGHDLLNMVKFNGVPVYRLTEFIRLFIKGDSNRMPHKMLYVKSMCDGTVHMRYGAVNANAEAHQVRQQRGAPECGSNKPQPTEVDQERLPAP